MTTWNIAQLERRTSDGFVTTAHWTCSGVDGEFSGNTYGSIGLEGVVTTAYEDITEEQAIGWVRYGFKAQDVLALEGANPVIVDNEDVDKLRMVDTALIPVLVKALQELNAKFDAYVLTHP